MKTQDFQISEISMGDKTLVAAFISENLIIKLIFTNINSTEL